MIRKLRGLVDETDEDSAIIDVGGVGYHVFCSARTLAALPAKGHPCELWIETHVREDHFHLYGFPSAYELRWFNLITTVQGVGAKVGLALLTALPPEALAQAIAAKDSKSITRANGVGNKLAERICSELKDKVVGLATGSVTPPANSGTTGKTRGKPAPVDPQMLLMEDALSALVHLGYGRGDAFSALAHAQKKLDEKPTLDNLIKAALKELVAA